MRTVLDQHALNALHPFSFVADRSGSVIAVGRSLSKISPVVRSTVRFADVFLIEQPTLGITGQNPSDLLGELIVLSPRAGCGPKLRGQVALLDETEGIFLFALTPILTDASQVSAVGLEFADFPVGDPVFDFLLFIQAQRIGRTRLEVANRKLQWEHTVSKLLHDLTLRTYDVDDAEHAYAVVVSAVCEALKWNIGHVFVSSAGNQPVLRSTATWYLSDPLRYARFRELTDAIQFARGEGLPGRAWERESVVWVDDIRQDLRFPRRAGLPEGAAPIAGVAVPVIAEGELVAVLEFFTERPPHDKENLARFFDLLGLQLAGVISRQRIVKREREQLAALVSASKMAALGEIAAGVAHEINNPVSSISLTSQLMSTLAKTGALDAPAVETNTARIKACVQRITTIVSELRDFSRDSSHDPFTSVSLKKIVDETLDLCGARFGSKGVKLEVGTFPAEWQIECRPSQISQVLLNLLNNAYDAVVSRDTRWVRLEGREVADAFEIAVTDSGPGIEEDVVEKIMVPFFTTKPPGMGTGLGLSISSNIVTDHGGELHLDRNACNTRFAVVLPKSSHKHESNEAEEDRELAP